MDYNYKQKNSELKTAVDEDQPQLYKTQKEHCEWAERREKSRNKGKTKGVPLSIRVQFEVAITDYLKICKKENTCTTLPCISDSY